jgi:hypothetical protein
MILTRFFLKRLRKSIFRDTAIRLVVALSLAFGLIINVASLLVRPLWFG